VLLADEPTAGLDPGHQLDVMTTLRGLSEEGRAVVVVMHDLTLAARFCTRLTLVHGGKLVADGAPEAVLSADNLARFYGIEAHRGTAGGFGFVVPMARTTGESDRAAP
jgi:iron complex transport system ATP-binding protein